MIDEDKQDKLIDKAKEMFGTTDSCYRAGYILPDGEMLNFGNPDRDYDYRFQDHSEILQVYNEFPEIPKTKPLGKCFYYNYNDQFLLETGAIRLSTGTLRKQLNGEMFQPHTPTKRQLETMEYCSCTVHPNEIIMELSKCDIDGRYIPKIFTERVIDDCVEPINDLNNKIKKWKKEKVQP